MDERDRFTVYCVELYRTRRGLNGRQVMDLFSEHGVIEYIERFYDVLHTMGDGCILEDIDGLIEERRRADVSDRGAESPKCGRK